MGNHREQSRRMVFENHTLPGARGAQWGMGHYLTVKNTLGTDLNFARRVVSSKALYAALAMAEALLTLDTGLPTLLGTPVDKGSCLIRHSASLVLVVSVR